MAINTITYTNKVALNVNADVPDINKVKADDMNEIKTVVNANANGVGDISTLKTNDTTDLTSGVNSIIDSDVYSTTEVKTNKTWVTGKPIYRIAMTSVNTGTLDSSSWKNLVAVPTNADLITEIYGYEGGNIYPRYESSSYFLMFNQSGGYIRTKGAGYNNRNLTLVLEYTKTTD